ncbi:MAG: hypothetical protein GY794_07460 [bacterium]|nr:hypothetical protein [bacterium]
MSRYLNPVITVTLLGLLTCGALGVTPATWSHSTEAQFIKGKFKSAVLNARGDISLARKSEILFGSADAPPVISAMVVRDRVIYAGAGNEPVIYRIKGKKFKKFATLQGTTITSLAIHGKQLLAGVGGDEGGIYSLNASGKVKKLWTDKDVKYVWAILPTRDGKLYAATGAKGRIYLIDSKGKAEVIYETGKLAKNILAIAISKNTLYAGTDTSGLVVAIDIRTKSSRVVLDTAEAEISAIIPAPDGGLFVATADVAKASPDGKTPPANGAKNGKSPTPLTQPSERTTTRPAKSDKSAKSAKPSKKMIISLASRVAAIKGAKSPQKRPTASKGKNGNAVYYIQPSGLVRTVFRKPVTILAMLLKGKNIILATGNGGAVYSVGIDGEQSQQLIDTEARQITALASSGDNIVFATANKGSVGIIDKSLASKGSYSSEAMDASQIVQWGTMRLAGLSSNGSKVTVATRSGNLAKPDDKTWSSWSKEQTVNGGYIPIMSPSARFLQYRLSLAVGQENTGPVVSGIALIYQMGNLAPVVSSVLVKSSSHPGKPIPIGQQKYRMVAIGASDPNGDKLVYRLEYRRIGSETWVQITDEHDESTYVWDTLSVGDGQYEIRITANDSPTNVTTATLNGSRISERILVDNTPPVIKNLSVKATATTAAVQAALSDAGSRIVAIAYTVDSKDTWKTALPRDGICDSATEKLDIQIKDMSPGKHRIAVRITDQYGNISYGYIVVTIVAK